jgi:hypothetical protein
MNSMTSASRGALRALIALLLCALVVGGAYLAVRAPGSGSALIVRPQRAPVKAALGPVINLGRARAVLSGGPAGLFVAERPRHGASGSVSRVDTAAGRLGRRVPLDVAPLGMGVGSDAVWVLAGRRLGARTTLLCSLHPRPAPRTCSRAAIPWR